MDYFLGNRHLGGCPNPPPDPRTLHNYNLAFFCPTCGEIWGRVIVGGRRWHTLAKGCHRCGPPWPGAGSGTFLETSDVWWSFPQLHITKDTPMAVLLNDFNQLEKEYD